MPDRHADAPIADRLDYDRCPLCGRVRIQAWDAAGRLLMVAHVSDHEALRIADHLVELTDEPREIVGHA